MDETEPPRTRQPFTIREAGPDDAEAVAGFVRALNAHERLPLDEAPAAAIRRDLGRDEITALLAEAAGEPIGHCLYHFAYESTYAASGLYIVDLYVNEARRGQGVGKALIAEVARRAKAMGGRYVWWASKPENERANAAYARLGAFTEPVLAHAVFDESFEALVAAAEARSGTKG